MWNKSYTETEIEDAIHLLENWAARETWPDVEIAARNNALAQADGKRRLRVIPNTRAESLAIEAWYETDVAASVYDDMLEAAARLRDGLMPGTWAWDELQEQHDAAADRDDAELEDYDDEDPGVEADDCDDEFADLEGDE